MTSRTAISATVPHTPLFRSPFRAGYMPHSVAVDPTGKFAYVANGGSNNVSGYRIDRSTGALDPVPGSPFAAGSGPISVAISPLGPFASSFFLARNFEPSLRSEGVLHPGCQVNKSKNA